ncbi:glycine zipper 2TM domain-containing protein [Aurantiacibacter aquimixticola]|uniref:17 kDa surface antigen n=1 Tax=Aurantiacibacter aquimixticola TaxID=1958945 RepID=A0A419RSV3_9SPHN|nr:glycine zipper 2TM domain-containing protein [Aurantiacibacter aquimixticola]RJY08882.1 glycine zipper 2TM domain-containing protein [Aurantiacibacter aquimixticola]
MKKTLLAIAAATTLAIPAAPALAQGGPPPWAPAHGYRDNDRGYDRSDRYDRQDRRRYRQDRRSDRRYRQRTYDDYGRYYEPRRVRRGDRVWQGRDGRYYCERENGTTGLIIGAAGGALVGRAIDTRGDRTVGTLLGAALGAVLGREIDRGSARCR